MLPLTLQIPAALVLVIGGAITCFAGYRLFRIVLGIYGFVLGALVATTLAGSGSGSTLWLWAIGGGIAGALLLNVAYFFGVVLVGAAMGALAVSMLWPRGASDPHVLVVIACAVAGAVAAIWLQRYVIVIGTALGGAWTLIVGVLALAGDRAAQAASDVWVVYPLDPAPGRWWLPVVWLAVSLAGIVAQVSKPGSKSTKVKKVRK